MKKALLPASFLALFLIGHFARQTEAAVSAQLLPFQGRLTDANGNAVADGSRVVQFKIYDAPVGGRAAWDGEVQNLTINAGLVSTLLGSKAAFSGIDFNQDLYLELTIDANGDGQIGLADPPLLPRQSILPAIFAKESRNAQTLDGYDWSALFGATNPAAGTLLPTKIADNSLTTAKLRNDVVTAAKIANGAVARTKLDTNGAVAGQTLTYNGSEVVWTAGSASLLDGYDWSTIFHNGNPETGELNVANARIRNSLVAVGVSTESLTVTGTAFLNGGATVVQGLLLAPSVGLNMFLNDWGLYFRAVGDFNHYLKWGNGLGNISGFDGPILMGNGGGALGGGGDWSLRWNANGTVQVRGRVTANGVLLSSDRNLKENFAQLDPHRVLDKVLSLPVTRWNYKNETQTEQHIGPTAQDFHAAFQLSADDRHISLGDQGGVALAAIQGLNRKLEEKESEMRQLVRDQQEQIELLKAEIAALKRGQR